MYIYFSLFVRCTFVPRRKQASERASKHQEQSFLFSAAEEELQFYAYVSTQQMQQEQGYKRLKKSKLECSFLFD